MRGLLYSGDDLFIHVLKTGFARAGVKLYDFPDFGDLEGHLGELEAQFILLDTNSLCPGKEERTRLAQGPLPLFCLGDSEGGGGPGRPLPGPLNPRELPQKIISLLQ